MLEPGSSLLAIVVMILVAVAIGIAASRFMSGQRAVKFAILLTALISLPFLVPGMIGLGIALMGGFLLVNWQLSLRDQATEDEGD